MTSANLHEIPDMIHGISGSCWIPTYPPSGDRFKEEITDNIKSQEISERLSRAEDDTNAVVMFTQPKHDRVRKVRFLLDCSLRNAVTIRQHTSLPNIEEGIDIVTTRSTCRVIDPTDVYHNICMNSESAKHTTCLWHIEDVRSRVMLGGDCNTTAIMVRAINKILPDMILQDLIINIYDLIISSTT